MRGGDSFSRQIHADPSVVPERARVVVAPSSQEATIEAIGAILRLSHEPLALLSVSSGVLAANSAFTALTGACSGTILGERISPTSWSRLSALLTTAPKGIQAELQAELLDCNGRRIAMAAKALPLPAFLPGEAGQVVLRLVGKERGATLGDPGFALWNEHFPDRVVFINSAATENELSDRLERLAQGAIVRSQLATALEIVRTEGAAVLYPRTGDHEENCSLGDVANATELRLVAVASTPQRESGILAIARDGVIDPVAAKRNQQLARQDPLTGLANRRAFGALVQRDLERFKSGNSECLALIYVDLDGFKTVNDQGGHETGDLMLREVANVLRRSVGELGHPDAPVGRLGGDEFAVSCTVACHEDGLDMAWRVLKGIVDIRLERNGSIYRIGASIGVAVIQARDCMAGTKASDILHQADIASLAGKNFDEPTVFNAPWPAAEPVRLVAPRGVCTGPKTPKAGELELFVQPIRLFASGRLAAGEVLLRTPEAGRGRRSPRELVTTAVRRGYISRIDCWVLDQIIDRLASAPARMLLSVNICGQSAVSGDLWQMLRTRVGKDPVLAKSLCLELRETDLLSDIDGVGTFMRRASGLGCQLAIDSFGGGWAAVSAALDLKVDWLKLDASLTKQLAGGPVLATITRPLVHQLAGAGIRTIAKNVETTEEYRSLKALGVTAVQGYLIGRPQKMSAECRVLR
ncbi:EAL domain-containing protein [Roseibium sediminis]|uniref:EAL domain-containing protein n=1 Tax=Roseibium sediminis TaxID=1775174 RepID=UPI00123D8478|nr:EAL domain-containing protein [Roseibium sediminis]